MKPKATQPLRDDTRSQCLHCQRRIRWSDRQRKWFHMHNFVTFCTGMATSPTVAVPVNPDLRRQDKG